ACPLTSNGGEGRGEGAVHGQGGRRSDLSVSGGTREKRKQAEDRGSAQRGRPATHEGSLEHWGNQESRKNPPTLTTTPWSATVIAMICIGTAGSQYPNGAFTVR